MSLVKSAMLQAAAKTAVEKVLTARGETLDCCSFGAEGAVFKGSDGILYPVVSVAGSLGNGKKLHADCRIEESEKDPGSAHFVVAVWVHLHLEPFGVRPWLQYKCEVAADGSVADPVECVDPIMDH